MTRKFTMKGFSGEFRLRGEGKDAVLTVPKGATLARTFGAVKAFCRLEDVPYLEPSVETVQISGPRKKTGHATWESATRLKLHVWSGLATAFAIEHSIPRTRVYQVV